MTPIELQRICHDALASVNVQAFLRVIRAGETSQGDEAYCTLVGGGRFEKFDDHPRQTITVRPGLKSTAAGAYQFLSRTWDECAVALELPDFSPPMQDLAAVFLIRRRGALDDVIAGRFEAAVMKCNREWASLPGSPYGQPTKSMAQAWATYKQYGGSVDTSPGHVQEPDDSSTRQTEKRIMPIPAVIAALGATLIDIFSPLAKEKVQRELGRHATPEVAEQVATAAVEAAKEATGRSDPVQAVAAVTEAAQAGNTTIVQQIEASALDTLDRLAPLLDKVAKWDADSRMADEASMDAASRRASGESWDMAPTLIYGAFGMLGGLVLFVCAVAAIQAWNGDIKPEVWAQVAGLIGFATGVGTTIYAYRFGTSRSSAAKDLVIGELSRRGKV